jgi:hypothetical protein
MEGVLENVPAVRLESRHRLVAQTPFLAYLRSSSASLALLCSIVEEKSFFVETGDDGPSGSRISISVPFPWIFLFPQMDTL